MTTAVQERPTAQEELEGPVPQGMIIDLAQRTAMAEAMGAKEEVDASYAQLLDTIGKYSEERGLPYSVQEGSDEPSQEKLIDLVDRVIESSKVQLQGSAESPQPSETITNPGDQEPGEAVIAPTKKESSFNRFLKLEGPVKFDSKGKTTIEEAGTIRLPESVSPAVSRIGEIATRATEATKSKIESGKKRAGEMTLGTQASAASGKVKTIIKRVKDAETSSAISNQSKSNIAADTTNENILSGKLGPAAQKAKEIGKKMVEAKPPVVFEQDGKTNLPPAPDFNLKNAYYRLGSTVALAKVSNGSLRDTVARVISPNKAAYDTDGTYSLEDIRKYESLRKKVLLGAAAVVGTGVAIYLARQGVSLLDNQSDGVSQASMFDFVDTNQTSLPSSEPKLLPDSPIVDLMETTDTPPVEAVTPEWSSTIGSGEGVSQVISDYFTSNGTNLEPSQMKEFIDGAIAKDLLKPEHVSGLVKMDVYGGYGFPSSGGKTVFSSEFMEYASNFLEESKKQK